ATKLLKDAGFKVLYQVMPNLPGSTFKKDLELFKVLFNDERFKPDWLKIYPCLICPKTKLFKMWQQGKYKPYTEKQLINLLLKAKQEMPYWVRIARIFRDIPSHSIVAGCKTSNIREVLPKNKKCNCIRCREVKGDYQSKEKIYLFREDYNASGGKEIFLSFENKKRTKLYSILRLRISNTAIIRELQTFGSQLSVKEKSQHSPQHKGLGKKLIKKAEAIALKEFGLKKIVVISGIGARQYYKKLGYRLKDTYMIKSLNN
ncbi:unnamed protein product, partial [marine sediment metagenome]